MAYFNFKVKNSKGEIIENFLYAENLSDAATKLEQKGYTLLEIKVKTDDYTPQKSINTNYSKDTTLSIQEKKQFFNAFYSLYKSGHSTLEIFNSIYNSTPNQKIKSICAKILQGIKKGCTLKEAMEPCSPALSKAYTTLVVAGDESGKLEETLSGITKNILTQEKVKNEVISKITYPIIIFCLAIFIAILFKSLIFEIFNTKILATETSTIFIIIKFCVQIIITYGLLGGIIFALYKNKSFTQKLISKLTSIKPFKNLILDYTYSNYFSVLSLAYSAGLSLSEALYISSTVVTLPEITKQLNQVAPRVQQGCELTTALGATMLFSDYATSEISTGEKSGELDKTLAAVAYDYETKLKVSLDVMLKFLEPLMIILVGIITIIVLVFGFNQISEMFTQYL